MKLNHPEVLYTGTMKVVRHLKSHLEGIARLKEASSISVTKRSLSDLQVNGQFTSASPDNKHAFNVCHIH